MFPKFKVWKVLLELDALTTWLDSTYVVNPLWEAVTWEPFKPKDIPLELTNSKLPNVL